MSGSAPDPPVRDDGRCAVCGGERTIPKRKPHREAALRDPFCSNDCARAWHGFPLAKRGARA